MTKSVLIPLAEGCEEIEAVTLIDLLRRANISVVTASLAAPSITASRGVHLTADTDLKSVVYNDFDMIVLPGGLSGALNLNDDHRIHAIIKRLYQAGKAVGAICAAPLVLANTGLLDGKRICCYPGALNPDDWPTIQFVDDPVVIDGNILTSRGPGTAMDFALTIISFLTDEKTRADVETALVRPH